MLRRDASWLLAIFLFAFVPFLLKHYDPRLEPYPALLFPDGVERFRVRDSGELVTARLELVGVGPEGDEHALDPAAFLDPISVYSWPVLARRGLGLMPPRPSEKLTIGRWSWRPRRAGPQDERQVRIWLRERLAAVGHADDVAIRVNDAVVAVDLSTGADTQRTVLAHYEVDLVNKSP